MNLDKLLRTNIKNLKPYSSARDEYTGEAMVFLDANENPFNQPYNRYPDPLQQEVKAKISALKNIAPENIFLGNGSDEPIDLLFRAFCEPGIDNIVTIDPTYGMYQVAADVNNVAVRKVLLDQDYQFNAEELLAKTDKLTKLIFLCSPNNPTGNLLSSAKIRKVAEKFQGLVIIDEAYIDFCPDKSLLPELEKYENMVILQTFSKAWGMAGIRLGMAFANESIIQALNKIKYPYNINVLTQRKALDLLEKVDEKNSWVKILNDEKLKLEDQLKQFPFVEKIFPSDANFILVKMHDAKGIYDYLIEKGVIVRDRSKVVLCDNSLRITIGSENENETLINELNELI